MDLVTTPEVRCGSAGLASYGFCCVHGWKSIIMADNLSGLIKAKCAACILIR